MPRVYTTTILNTEYKYRGATRRELDEALRLKDQVDVEDFLCTTCVISPTNINWPEELAGIPIKLSEDILNISGMNEESMKELQKEAEEWILTPSGKLEALMMGVLHLSLEEVQQLDPPDWYKTAAAAQTMLAINGVDIEKILNPPKKRPIMTMPPVAKR